MSLSIEEVLPAAPLFSGLSDEVVKSVAARAQELKLDRDEILFISGEPAKGLYVIAEGTVRAFRTGVDGREQVIHVERAVTTIAGDCVPTAARIFSICEASIPDVTA